MEFSQRSIQFVKFSPSTKRIIKPFSRIHEYLRWRNLNGGNLPFLVQPNGRSVKQQFGRQNIGYVIVNIPANQDEDNHMKTSSHSIVEQSYPYLLELQKVTQKLVHGDYSTIFGIERQINKIIKKVLEINMMNEESKSIVKDFQNMVATKIQPFKYSNKVYKYLLSLIKLLERKIDYKGVKVDVGAQTLTDTLYKLFINNVEKTEEGTSGISFVKDENQTDESLMLKISKCPEFFYNHHWQQIFTMTQTFINIQKMEQEQANTGELSEKSKVFKKKFEFFKKKMKHPEFQLKNPLDANYFAQDINIVNLRNDTLVSIGGPIKDIWINNKNTRRLICEMLNSGRQGVILFDCQGKYLNILPRGQFIIQKRKEDMRDCFRCIMSFISPQPKEEQDYLLDFLPVVENPFLYEKFELTKIKSLYVVRLRTLRASNRKEFICNIDLKSYFFKRLKSIHSGPQFTIQEEREAIEIDHKLCYDVFGKTIIPEHKLNQNDLTKDMIHVSIIKIPSEFLPYVRLQLKKYSINSYTSEQHIDINHEKQVFQVIYHDKPYSELLEVIEHNPAFCFERKQEKLQVQVVQISQCLRITNQNPEDVLKKSEFEKIKFWMKTINNCNTVECLKVNWKNESKPSQYLKTEGWENGLLLDCLVKKVSRIDTIFQTIARVKVKDQSFFTLHSE